MLDGSRFLVGPGPHEKTCFRSSLKSQNSDPDLIWEMPGSTRPIIELACGF